MRENKQQTLKNCYNSKCTAPDFVFEKCIFKEESELCPEFLNASTDGRPTVCSLYVQK